MIYNPKVSIIVPTKNSDFLETCLQNLQKQTYLNIEIIVVDNYSNDDTVKIAKKYAHQFYQIGPERTTQANYGIGKATGELIYLTGSDMTRDWNFIEEAVKEIRKGYDAIYMSVLTDCYVKHFWGKVKAMERLCYIGDDTIESARFFRKFTWEMLGGFDENLISMEEDFQHRLDRECFKTGRISAREYHLHEEDSLSKIFKKSFYYGKFMKKYLKKHKSRGVKQLQPFRNFKLFLKHPLLLAGLIIYKFVQYMGGALGLILG